MPDQDEAPGSKSWRGGAHDTGHRCAPWPSEGQIPILPGLMQSPIPAGLVLVIDIVLDSPTTRAPKPGHHSSDPAEHGRLPLLCPGDARSSSPDARPRRPAPLVSSVRVAAGPRSVRTASGRRYGRAVPVTTGRSSCKPQHLPALTSVARPAWRRLRIPPIAAAAGGPCQRGGPRLRGASWPSNTLVAPDLHNAGHVSVICAPTPCHRLR
jgi:hypothetical protein